VASSRLWSTREISFAPREINFHSCAGIYIRAFVGSHISNENPLYYAEVDHPSSGGGDMQHMARVPLDGQRFYALTVRSID